ncbi:hypothetical protein BZA70DRAFT_283961 [Myxozyma melibiosi]|uniref:Uncharacterized protein n=1 Tax=Myxozyma melibiosi TaxID=54550 RepID=A0ABR1EZV2_9ASCO
MKFSALTLIPAVLALATTALASVRVRMYTVSTSTALNDLDLGSQLETDGEGYIFLGNHGGQFYYYDVLNTSFHSDATFGDVYYFAIEDNIVKYTTDTTKAISKWTYSATLFYNSLTLYWYACTAQDDPAGYNEGQYLLMHYGFGATVPKTCTSITVNVLAI